MCRVVFLVLLCACSAATAAVPRRPNILLLYSDQHNAGVLGCAGHKDVKTPELDRLAADGVRFERAYCQDAICQPSRTSLMTGLYPRSTGVLFNGDRCAPGVRIEPLAAQLQGNGYRTAAFGKRHLFNPQVDRAWDVTGTTLKPEFETSDEYYWQWVRAAGQWEAFDRDFNAEFGNKYQPTRATEMACLVSQLTADATMEAWTARKAAEFIRQSARGDKPFFCWVSFYRPHQPYTPLPQYYELYDQARLSLPESIDEPFTHLPPRLWELRNREKVPWCFGRAAKDKDLFRRFLACYYGCMTEIDHHVGQLMRVLCETGQAENTIVIYTADHGDFVGCHGLIEKHPRAHNVYEDTLRVPLIVHWPGHVRQGDVRQDLVEQVDLYPTLLEMGGIAPPAGYALPGRSLVPTLTNGAEHGRRFAVCENPYMLTAVGPRMKLGAWIEPQKDAFPDMLFDRQSDPLELTNLRGRPETATAERELREQLARWVRQVSNASGKPLVPLCLQTPASSPAALRTPTPQPVRKPLAAAKPSPQPAAPLVWNRVRFWPAPRFEKAMVGGRFLGSNGPDLPHIETQSSDISLSGFKLLATIEHAPAPNQWTELTFANQTAYRWVVYAAPPGSHGKVAEIEFYAGQRRLIGRPFDSFSPAGAARRATDGSTSTTFDGHDADGQFAGLDIGVQATGPGPSMTPIPGEFKGTQTVVLTAHTPGATIRYTLDGTLPSTKNGTVYCQPLEVSRTTTLSAVAFQERLAPTPPAVGTYLIGSAVRQNSLHVGNSLTQNASAFHQRVQTAGYRNDGCICGLGGAWTKKLWEATLSSGKPEYSDYKKRWDSALATLARVDHFTMQPRDFDVAEEADYDIRFMDLLRRKWPQVQPWLYIEWTEMNRKRPTDLGTQPTAQMKKVWPAATWEESMAAMVLYGEDLRQKILETYRQGNPPRVLPTALALGWLHRLIEEGRFPGIAPGEFYPKLFRDNVHLKTEGAYLVECTWFAAFFGQSPEDKFLPTRTNLTAAQARIMQRLAWDAIKNYPDCGRYEEGSVPVAKPQFSPAPSRITEVTPVKLSSATPGAWFRYTLDGTTPTRTRGYVYCGLISVQPGMTVKAVAYRSGMADSPVAEATYH